MRGWFWNYSLFSEHVPKKENDMEEKDTFYDILEREYDKCPKHGIKPILWDFNAQVGQEEHVRTTAGRNSLHRNSNDNGYVASACMVIGSIMFLP